MRSKLLLILSLCSILIFSNSYVALANYSIVFGGTGPGAGSYNLATPIAGYPAVTSGWNEPRNVSSGTNPHRGSDLSASTGTRVNAVCNGWVVSQNDTSTYELVLKCDRNNNMVNDDDLEIKYDHLSKVGFVSNNTFITSGTKIAESGTEGGAFPAHLHFGAMADRNGTKVWVRNEPYYRGTSNWSTGKDLDFISNVRWNNNTVTVNAYTMNDGVKEPLNSTSVTLFHRLNGTSTWSSVTMSKSGDDYSYNLGNLYTNNQTVHWMVRAQRPGLPSGIYNVAFMNPKYAQPSSNPNGVSNAYDYTRCVIGGACTAVTTP